jgi:3-phosphoglycerate kinase
VSFDKKTIEDIDLKGKTVLLRADYNVPLTAEGKLADDYRILGSLPTIQYLLKQNCKIIICSHLGRPEGKRDMKFSLKQVAKRLEKLLDHSVQYVDDCIGDDVKKAKKQLKKGEILLLENLRFYEQEKANDADFAKELAQGVDVMVQDGFGVVHRAHASTDAVTKFLPSVAGYLLEKEVTTIRGFIEEPKRPMMAIVGGAKIADKIDVLKAFIKQADFVAIGGAMANTFLLARGIKVGDSMVEHADVDEAKDIIAMAQKEAKKRPFVFYIPQDAVVAEEIDKQAHTRIVDWDAHVIANIENYPKLPAKQTEQVKKTEMILDIGPFSAAFIAGAIQTMETVIWNGTMGVAEVPGVQGPIGPFAHGTETIIEAMLGEFGRKPKTLVGGGDTAGYVESRGLGQCFSFVSTGGGASLDLMSGKKLPGVEALDKK